MQEKNVFFLSREARA